MPSRIDVVAPATITVLAGSNAVSLATGAISLTDPNAAGTITVTLTTADPGTTLAAGSGGGASVSSHGGTLAITGSAAQVNAALAGLQVGEAAGATTDTIFVTAGDPAELPRPYRDRGECRGRQRTGFRSPAGHAVAASQFAVRAARPDDRRPGG